MKPMIPSRWWPKPSAKPPFPDHPYGRPVRGDLATIDSLQRDDLDALRGRIFARKDLKIAVVGAIDAATLSRRLDETFGAWAQDNALTPVAPITLSNVGQRKVVPLDIPQSAMRFGRPGLRKTDPDYFAAVVVNHILGGGVFTARLFREVREKRGLAYSVYSQLNEYDQCPMLLGGNSTKNERAGESLRVIEEQFRELGENGPTPKNSTRRRNI